MRMISTFCAVAVVCMPVSASAQQNSPPVTGEPVSNFCKEIVSVLQGYEGVERERIESLKRVEEPLPASASAQEQLNRQRDRYNMTSLGFDIRANVIYLKQQLAANHCPAG